MEIKPTGYRSIDEYIAMFPVNVQNILVELRAVIKANAPGSEEKISYQMPAFAQKGNLVWFAAYKNHIGFYPTPGGIEAFQQELSNFELSKGTIRFPIDKPLPFELIGKMVKFRVAENLKKAERKMIKKK